MANGSGAVSISRRNSELASGKPRAVPYNHSVDRLDIRKVLHLGAGRSASHIRLDDYPDAEVLTLDRDPTVSPTIVCTLGDDPIPLEDDSIDFAVAIHVLEHIGRQGETEQWFQFWEEIYRVIRPGGILHVTAPLYSSMWAWADPSHTRALCPASFLYFSQDSYRQPDSAISPFRIRCDFESIGFEGMQDTNADVQTVEKVSHFRGELRAIKPFRGWWED